MQLLYSPNPFLEKKVQPFDFDKLDAKSIAEEMIEIMYKHDGIGLSANQVGLDAQIFVMRPLELSGITEPFAVINPKIHGVSDDLEERTEGCLSHPNLGLKVSRPKTLIAEFLDIEGKTAIINFTGIDARCFLHEYDHLQGIEFIDRVSKLKLNMAKKKQLKLMRKLQHG